MHSCLTARQMHPAPTWRGPGALWMSSLRAFAIAFPMMRLGFSPMPMGRTPGHLVRATTWHAINAVSRLGQDSWNRCVWQRRLMLRRGLLRLPSRMYKGGSKQQHLGLTGRLHHPENSVTDERTVDHFEQDRVELVHMCAR